jgi:hydroxyethylthiazole kinase-like uncharacterized protein yjeF
MKILTSEEMRAVDRKAIEEVGIPGAVLMENAGLQVYEALKELFPRPDRERITIVAGKGNNGGDGLVVARHLFINGARPTVLLLARVEDLHGDAGLNAQIGRRIGLEIKEIGTPVDWAAQRTGLRRSTVIVDAVFGTGLTQPAGGIFATVIKDINRCRAFKLAVDIPSGLSSDSFEVIGPAVRADLTVTLAAPKVAHVFPPAESLVGVLRVANISEPPAFLQDPGLKLELVEKDEVRPFFEKRASDTHKGTYGHLLCVGGSWGKTGSISMSAKAALRLGAGLVTVATAESCLPLVARSMMELMTEPLPETKHKTIAAEAAGRVLELLRGKTGLLLGPGLSTDPSTAEFVRALLPRIKVPTLIDADGLNIIAANPDLLQSLKTEAVLTPHPGEFSRLIGVPIPEVLAKRLELAPAFARDRGVHLVLKGYRTLTCAPDGRVFVNPTGNPGMATGGAGDVLSGMIASLMIQEKDMPGAVRAAVYLHGLAGDLGAEKLGEKFLAAGDLIRFVPAAIKALERESSP